MNSHYDPLPITPFTKQSYKERGLKASDAHRSRTQESREKHIRLLEERVPQKKKHVVII